MLYVSPLKALAVDVERNLRAPLDGHLAGGRGARRSVRRAGDCRPQRRYAAAERARFQREPADILITTPESLYLLLTSNAREALRSIETVIVDEIHALVPTKRGAHLALSLERLAALCDRPLQRIGLSATQRPLDEVARFLGGVDPLRPAETSVAACQATRPIRPGTADAARQRRTGIQPRRSSPTNSPTPRGQVRYRPVTIVDAGAKKALSLTIEVPVEDMAKLTTADDIPSGPASVGDQRPSIWSAIHPRLLELIRAHRSTLIFVNSRRLAERLAGALNELAGETLVALAPRIDRAAAARRRSRTCSRRDRCARWWPRRRSSSASTWAPSTWSSRSRRRRRWRAACSASAAADTRSTRPARASSSRSSEATSSPARRSPEPCTTARSRPPAIPATLSTSSRSRSWR